MTAVSSNNSSNPPSYISYLVLNDSQQFDTSVSNLQHLTNAVGYIKGYCLPEKPSCMDVIKHIAYRIWNAFKAIFGMSDWQKARKEAVQYVIYNSKLPHITKRGVDFVLNTLLSTKIEKDYEDMKVTLTFLQIVQRASKAKSEEELDAVGQDKTVLDFLHSQKFKDFLAEKKNERDLSTKTFGNAERINFALQRLPMKS